MDNSVGRLPMLHHQQMARPPDELPPALAKAPFTVSQALASGLSRKRLRGHDLDRPFHGVRRLQTDPSFADPPDRHSYAAAVLAHDWDALALVLPREAFLSHLTAARLWPVPLPEADPDEPLHVGVPRGRQPPHRRGVVGHHITDPNAYAVHRDGRLFIDPASMFCQLGRHLRLDDLVAVGDALILAPKFTQDAADRPWLPAYDLARRVAVFRGRGKARAEQAVALIRPGSESRMESLLRVAAGQAGLPAPEINADVHAADGTFLGCGDLVYRRRRVIAEYDGDHHRSNSRQYAKDVGRLERFGAHGWRVVRVTGPDFFADRRACVGRIDKALRAAGWIPGDPC